MSLSSSPYVLSHLLSFLLVYRLSEISAGHWSRMCLAVSSHTPHSLQVLVVAKCLVSMSARRVLEPVLSLKINRMASVSVGLLTIYGAGPCMAPFGFNSLYRPVVFVIRVSMRLCYLILS